MPSMPGAIEHYNKAGIVYAPGKAANAGGVAVRPPPWLLPSGLLGSTPCNCV